MPDRQTFLEDEEMEQPRVDAAAAVPGILGRAMNPQPRPEGARAELPSAVSGQMRAYEPAQIQYDNQADSISQRVSEIVAKDSPVQQQAETRALQNMNTRGLLNSSMAVEAGQKAIYDYAVPIATQDLTNRLSVRMQNATFENASREQARAGEIQSQLQVEKGQIDFALQSADTQNRLQLLDRQGDIDIEIQQLDGMQRESLQAQQGEINRQLEMLRAENQSDLTAEQAQYEQDLVELRGNIEQQLQGQQERHDVTMAERSEALQRELQELRGTQATALAELENQYRTILQSQTNAAVLYAQVSTAMGEILAQPDITVANKQQLIDHQIDLLAAGLQVIGGIANLDIGAQLNFNAPGSPGPQPEETDAIEYPDPGISIPGVFGARYGITATDGTRG